jgi:hypothetical protein
VATLLVVVGVLLLAALSEQSSLPLPHGASSAADADAAAAATHALCPTDSVDNGECRLPPAHAAEAQRLAAIAYAQLR